VGLDTDFQAVQDLKFGKPPLFEPGLEDLVKSGLDNGRLSFTTDASVALVDADVVWVTYDTPVDDDDQADINFVVNQIRQIFKHLAAGTLILISSQVTVGITRSLQQMYTKEHPAKPVSFAYSPENLRLGKAIRIFNNPDRVVVGIRTESDKKQIVRLLEPITDRIEWMSVESAEMTKHALNAFLATSITFINEIATLCEQVGADAREVERGLKSEIRIGPGAYLGPGAAFAGGTLARDIAFLNQIGIKHHQSTWLISAVQTSNNSHKLWIHRKILDVLAKGIPLEAASAKSLKGRTVAVWGLTYKPGTDTLRRSSSVELCEWIVGCGANVQCHDPAVKSLPTALADKFRLCPTPLDALPGASVLVVATAWPDYQNIEAEMLVSVIKQATVIDPGYFLSDTLGTNPKIQYIAIGKGNI
jgi:UDPglucose 6-dehydrogenase